MTELIAYVKEIKRIHPNLEIEISLSKYNHWHVYISIDDKNIYAAMGREINYAQAIHALSMWVEKHNT